MSYPISLQAIVKAISEVKNIPMKDAELLFESEDSLDMENGDPSVDEIMKNYAWRIFFSFMSNAFYINVELKTNSLILSTDHIILYSVINIQFISFLFYFCLCECILFFFSLSSKLLILLFTYFFWEGCLIKDVLWYCRYRPNFDISNLKVPLLSIVVRILIVKEKRYWKLHSISWLLIVMSSLLL